MTVALIGNHDFLGTGDQAYNVMFGEMNFSFIAGRVKFVCLNTNATEYDYMAAVPNFDYMEEEFAKDSAIFSLCLLVMQGHAMAQDSLRVAADDSLQLPVEQESRYDRHVNRAKQRWGSLIPRQLVLQNAGNMGLLSAGIGWDYGKRRQWETHLLIGFIPKHQSSRAKMTMTLKQNFIPWTLDLKHGWSLSPLTASLYVNTVYGNEFWRSQPHRYPDKYYEFMSTKLRLNIAIGQRLTFQIPYSKRKHNKSVSLFYEISSCDLYIRSKYMDSSDPLKDILSLSIGLKFQLL